MILSIRKVLLFLKTFILELFSSTYVVKMSAYFNVDGSLQKQNWGDDINYWFLSEIVDGRIISYDWSLVSRFTSKSYILGIGSLLTLFPIDNSIVWGSGVLSSSLPIRGIPKEVRAVRGPLSRKRLLEAGIDCPEVYGDPALLLPRYYTPKVQKKYKIGIIPHYKDQDSPSITKLKADKRVLIISTSSYNHWLDFIDQIYQCEAILSSSLHGLIVSEAYGIPNIWIKVNRVCVDDDIKYHDFFLSLGMDRNPVLLQESTTLEDFLPHITGYRRGNLNLQPLIEVCPYRLKDIRIIRDEQSHRSPLVSRVS